MKFWSVFMALVLVLASTEAWSQKRMGGGLSFGKQSSNVTQRNTPAAPPAQAPGQNTAQNPSAAQNPGMAPKPASASRPWGAMLGGLAAGLGLAWLASSLGLGEEFAQFLLLLLIGVVILAVVGLILRARAGAQKPRMAFQGAMGGQATAPSYNPGNVGNDASARPWERGGSLFSPAPHATGHTGQDGSLIGSALSGPQTWGIPAGFDVEGFLRASKGNFIKLQDAWDRADIPALRALMTDEMVEQIQAQIQEREQSSGGVPNKTEVVMLEARLLGIEELDGEYMASVEFSGMTREDASAGPNPFREVWNITRPKTGSGGWLVAGVQALQ